MEAKIEVMQSQAKEHLEPPEVERGKEAFSTITLGERATLPTPLQVTSRTVRE